MGLLAELGKRSGISISCVPKESQSLFIPLFTCIGVVLSWDFPVFKYLLGSVGTKSFGKLRAEVEGLCLILGFGAFERDCIENVVVFVVQ